jgi:putative transposase
VAAWHFQPGLEPRATEARANNAGGEIDEEAMEAIRRGWYLGKETFKDRLLKLLENPGRTSGGTRNRTGEALKEHGEAEAERIVRRAVKILGLPVTADAMAKLPKSDERKVTLAALLRDRTSVGNSWIARRLAMGHSGSVSRMIGSCRKSGEQAFTMKRLAKSLDQP